jgi:small-conductance mechanosensitive channel
MELLTTIWAYELVKKLVSILAVLAISFILRRYLVRHLNIIGSATGPLALERARINTIIQAAVRSSLGVLTLFVIISILFEGFAQALLGVGLLGVAAGFSLQAALKDYIAGILLLIEGQMHPGDTVCLNNTHTGVIERIDLRTTRILTGAGLVVILNSEVKNWQMVGRLEDNGVEIDNDAEA